MSRLIGVFEQSFTETCVVLLILLVCVSVFLSQLLALYINLISPLMPLMSHSYRTSFSSYSSLFLGTRDSEILSLF